METSAQKLQAVLYAHGGEMNKQELTSLLQISNEELSSVIEDLKHVMTQQGIELFETSTSLSLRTAREYAEIVAEIQQHDKEKDIGTAGLEVLAIVLYKGEVSRSSIDYIRGVNSSGTLRQLVFRGLLDRNRNENDARAWLYSATPELLAHIGVSSSEELPEFEALSLALNNSQEQQLRNNDDYHH